jgi:DNA primase
MKLERCNYETAIGVLADFNRFRSSDSYPLPKSRSSKIERLAKSHNRYFDPIHLREKYKIKFCGPIGDYRLRIIVPVFDRGNCISFTARDATNKASTPYLNCPNDKAYYDIRDTVYNLDNSTAPDVIVVEGVTDVWRIGDNTVATFGIKYTPHQVLTLTQYRRCFILFDAEPKAQEQADMLAKDLSTVVSEVIRLELPQGDPAEMSEDDVKSLRKQVFGRIY